jgi:S-adenosylmethionine hydrolase
VKSPAGSIISLTTNFGTADHYVGTMKAVILGIAPAARSVVIEVKPLFPAHGGPFAVT